MTIIFFQAAEFVCFGLYSVIDVLGIYGQKTTKVRNIRKTLYNVANHMLFSLVFPLSIVRNKKFNALFNDILKKLFLMMLIYKLISFENQSLH